MHLGHMPLEVGNMEVLLPLSPSSFSAECKYGVSTNVTTAIISEHRSKVSTRKSEVKPITSLCTEDPIIKSYASLLQACSNRKQLKNYHAHMLRTGLHENIFLLNKLVSNYAMTGNIEDACLLFDKMRQPKVFAWNAMIRGCAKNGFPDEALSFYYRMYKAGVQPDRYTFPFVFNACAALLALQDGKQIHAHILCSGFEMDVYTETALIEMYAKCGYVEFARQVFDKMSERNVVSWNAMIAGYSRNGHCDDALMLFQEMLASRIKPNYVTVLHVLPACVSLEAMEFGKLVHSYVIRCGFELDYVVETAFIGMYAKCGSKESARRVFDKMSRRDVISWNAMIAGYVQCAEECEALALFNYMISVAQKPNEITIMSVLPACAYLGVSQLGKGIHGYVIRNFFETNVSVMTSLIDMYVKCGNIEMAQKLFNNMFKRDVVAWNALIYGYEQNGYAKEVLILFNEMQSSDVKPSLVTMVSVVSACANLAALQHGEWIHAYIIQSGFESSISVGNSLVDMYAKCGSIDTAHKVFETMSQRDLVSWNSLISGYGMHGQGEEALALFWEMQDTGIKPDSITFLAVLSACSHSGLVDEGRQCFDAMRKIFCIMPKLEHYACMVDLLGRAGHLNEAMDLIENIPFKPSTDVWLTLLGACRLHGNIELGERVAEHVFDLDPENEACYILLSNIYAAAGRWNNVTKLRTTMRDMGLKKAPGCSLIQVQNRVYSFLVGDRSHPQSEKIYALLETLAVQMREAGYVPNTDVVLHNVENEVKEDMLSCHSEKLAIAFGLINTSPGAPIRIIKNLRVCGDCHSATKFISKIVNREIIVRDTNRFHRFKDGMCTCRDYW